MQKKRYGGAGVDPSLPYATQLAMKDHPVTLYTAPDCGRICADGKALLDNRGIPYSEVSVRSSDQVEDLRKLTGKNQVPTLQVGAELVSGFERGRCTAELDRAGYPASAGYRPRLAANASLPQVKLYINSECTALCTAARSLLAQRNVPFQEVEVETEASFEELQKVSGGMSVPVLVIGKVVQKGYEPATYNRLLDASGFSK